MLCTHGILKNTSSIDRVRLTAMNPLQYSLSVYGTLEVTLKSNHSCSAKQMPAANTKCWCRNYFFEYTAKCHKTRRTSPVHYHAFRPAYEIIETEPDRFKKKICFFFFICNVPIERLEALRRPNFSSTFLYLVRFL